MINRKVSSSPDRKIKDRPSINNCNSTRKITKNGEENFGLIENWLIALSYFLLIVTMPVSIFVSMKIVKEYERVVILRLGRIRGGPKGPGIFFVLPCIDNYYKVDLRTMTFDVPPQEILTKDSVTVTVDAVCFFRILDPVVSVVNVANVQHSTRLLAATTLCNILGTKTLQEILQDKDHLASQMQELIVAATEYWGVTVERVELKDVRLPVNMQRVMATEAEAAREARAQVIDAEGEQRSSVALAEAAKILSQSPMALQLRYLQTLSSIAAEQTSTIIFPVPLEMVF